jgi:transketolase
MDLTVEELVRKAQALRLTIVRMVGPGKPGHFGGSCSIADVVAALYFRKMRHRPSEPGWPDRDRLLLSKGHAAIVQYAALAMCGYFPEEELYRLKKLGAMLQGHPDMRKTPGIEANTGSLGQGLSIACGMAAGIRLDGRDARVYCVVGDGELAEGQIWEAAMAASFYRLDNLVGILDCNRIQATGPIAERFNSGPLAEKWAAFGWNVHQIDGHDMPQILDALHRADERNGKPTLILCHTVKGKGIAFAENTAQFHNGIMSQDQFDEACRMLEAPAVVG